MKRFSLTIFLTLIGLACSADTSSYCAKPDTLYLTVNVLGNDTIAHFALTDTASQQAQKAIILTPEQKKKKLLASFLAFPFPLGFLGTHRIMLGTKPWVWDPLESTCRHASLSIL